MSCECKIPCCPCIYEAEAGVVEFCGKFDKVIVPGFHCLCWPFQTVVTRMDLQIQHFEITCDTKTKDNVFVQVIVAVQYKVIQEKVSSAFYKLTDARSQIKSYVFDVVRSSMPTLLVDDAFASKDNLAHAVRDRLKQVMVEFGYEIVAALVIDLKPDRGVKAAMNEINASSRLREAAAEKAEAEKILQVKAAEADAESKYLSGMGIARERKAIVDGLHKSVAEFSDQIPGTSAKDVMDLMLITQYFDTIRNLGKSQKNATLFLPHGPESVHRLRAQLKTSFQAGFGSEGAKDV